MFLLLAQTKFREERGPVARVLQREGTAQDSAAGALAQLAQRVPADDGAALHQAGQGACRVYWAVQ